MPPSLPWSRANATESAAPAGEAMGALGQKRFRRRSRLFPQKGMVLAAQINLELRTEHEQRQREVAE